MDITGIVLGWIRDLLLDIAKPFLELKKVNELIFGIEGGQHLYHGTFTASEWNKIAIGGMNITITIAFYAILIGLFYFASQFSKAGINPQSRLNMMELFGSLLFVVVMVKNLPLLYEFMFNINDAVVGFFQVETGGTIDFGKNEDNLGWLLLWIASLGLTLWANIYYKVREITLYVLMILGPIIMGLFIFVPFRQVTMTWIRELFATIFTQAIHVVIFWIYLQISNDSNWVDQLVFLAVFIPIAESIKSLFGLNASMTGKMSVAAIMTGGMGLASVGAAAKSAFGQANHLDKWVRGRTERVGEVSGGTSNAGAGINAPLGRTAPVSSSTHSMLKWGKRIGNLGKAGAVIAGATAGVSLGPSGVLAGSFAGNALGDTAAPVLGRGVVAGVQGGKRLAGKAYDQIHSAINEEMNRFTNPLEQNNVTPAHQLGSFGAKVTASTIGTGKGIYRVGKNSVTSAAKGMASLITGKAVTRAYRGFRMATGKDPFSSAETKKQFVQAAGYVGGIIGGSKGYQAMANVIQNRSVAQSISPAEIIGSGSVSLTQGISYVNTIGNGKVRLVATNNESYLTTQVQENGKWVEKRISDFKGGVPHLKPGDMIFKDYAVKGGRFVELDDGKGTGGNGFYLLDSSNSKKFISQKVNANPYDYFNSPNKYFSPNRFKGLV